MRRRVSILLWLVLAMLLPACRRSPQMPVGNSGQYDLEMKDGPTCMLQVRLPKAGDGQRLTDVLGQFAAAHQIPMSPVRAFTPQGRELPRMYDNKDVLVSCLLFDFAPMPQDQQYGQIRISVVRRSYPVDRFRLLAEDFHATFQREFGERITLWDPPNDGTNDL